jgi:hypothetical protein
MQRFLVLFCVMMLSISVAAAQTDNGQPNDPAVNPDANACYTGGSLAGKCDWPTEAEDEWAWDCGWYIIRAEAGIFDSIPETCGELEEQIDEFAGLECETITGFNLEYGMFPMDRCVGFYVAYDDWFLNEIFDYLYVFTDVQVCPDRAGYIAQGVIEREVTSFASILYPQATGTYVCTYESLRLGEGVVR